MMRIADMSTNWFRILCSCTALLACQTVAFAVGPLAIQNATIITVSGERIEGGTVLVRDGIIEAVGTDVVIPGEALVLDGSGKVVMPGIIDAHNASGMSQANEQNDFVPFLSVVDSIDPISSYFEECRRNGITTAAVVPGNSTLIGGKSAIVKTSGQYVNDMLVRRDSALKLSLRPVRGNRMSQMAQLRKEFTKAQKALEDQEQEEDEESDEDEDQSQEQSADDEQDEGNDEDADNDNDQDRQGSAENEGLEALKLAVQGKLPVYIYCEMAMDCVAAQKLADEFNLDAILVLGQNCYKAADVLAKSEKHVILDPTLVFWETNPRTRQDERIALPAIYEEKGVPYIFQTSSASATGTLGSSYFWYQAATAVKHGASEQSALAKLTLEPAKLLGIDASVGSIEVGKEADLIVLTGDPLSISTWVEFTIVGGEVVYDRSEDEKLERLLSPKAE